MPEFLEKKLRAEYGNNSAAIYGTMNKLGAMHGNKETAKGREMERKHEDKMKTAPMHEMRIEIHRGPKNKISGFTVHHHMMPKATGKSGAFMENTHHSFPFSADEHEGMMSHVEEHLGAQSGEPMAEASKAEANAGAVEDGREES